MEQTINSNVTRILSKKYGIPIQLLSNRFEFDQLNLNENEFMDLLFDFEDAFGIEFPAKLWRNGIADQFHTILDIEEEIKRLIMLQSVSVMRKSDTS